MTRLIPRSLVNCPYPWESVYYRIPKHLNGNPHPYMNVNWTVKLWIYVLLNFTKLFELKSQIKMYRHSYRDRLHSNPHIQILRLIWSYTVSKFVLALFLLSNVDISQFLANNCTSTLITLVLVLVDWRSLKPNNKMCLPYPGNKSTTKYLQSFLTNWKQKKNNKNFFIII